MVVHRSFLVQETPARVCIISLGISSSLSYLTNPLSMLTNIMITKEGLPPTFRVSSEADNTRYRNSSNISSSKFNIERWLTWWEGVSLVTQVEICRELKTNSSSKVDSNPIKTNSRYNSSRDWLLLGTVTRWLVWLEEPGLMTFWLRVRKWSMHHLQERSQSRLWDPRCLTKISNMPTFSLVVLLSQAQFSPSLEITIVLACLLQTNIWWTEEACTPTMEAGNPQFLLMGNSNSSASARLSPDSMGTIREAASRWSRSKTCKVPIAPKSTAAVEVTETRNINRFTWTTDSWSVHRRYFQKLYIF